MRFMNIIDEKGRFVELNVETDLPAGQIDSHTISYLGAREARKQTRLIMGFEVNPFNLKFSMVNEAYRDGESTKEQPPKNYRNLIKSSKSRN